MGRYEDVQFSSLFGLAIIIISAHFHWFRKYSSLSMALYMYVSNRMHFGGRFLIVIAQILSYPGDFFLFSFFISSSTFEKVGWLISMLIWQRASKKLCTSATVSGSFSKFGLKTELKCSAKASAFSALLLQRCTVLLIIVVSLMVGLFRCLVDFYRL